jgi:hypothetical protein
MQWIQNLIKVDMIDHQRSPAEQGVCGRPLEGIAGGLRKFITVYGILKHES